MAPMKQQFALNTTAEKGKPSNRHYFRDLANEEIFQTLQSRTLLNPWKIVDEDVKKLGLRCFDQMRNVGLGCLLDMEEPIYPTIVREFYSNLQFDEASVEGKFYLRGKRGIITEKTMAKILGYKEVDSSFHALHPDFDRKEAITLLTGMNTKSVTYASMNFENQIMYHAMMHSVTPKYFKMNLVNSREIFYLWCIIKGHHLAVPFIVLSHMKAFINGDSKDIPYAMLITKIAKYFKVNLDKEEDTFEIGLKNAYNLKYLQSRMAKDRSEKSEGSKEEEDKERIADLKRSKKKAEKNVSVEPAKKKQKIDKGKKVVVEVEESEKTEEEEEEKKDNEEESETEQEGEGESNEEEEEETDQQVREPSPHPMDKGTIPQETPQKEKGVMEEDVQEEETADPVLQALLTISDQLEVSNKRTAELSQVMANGFQMMDNRLQRLDESLMDKRATDANHQEAVIEIMSRVYAKLSEVSVVKQERQVTTLTKLAARQLATRREISTPSHIPSVEFNPSASTEPKSPNPASSATPKPTP